MTFQIQEIIFIKAAYDISIDPKDRTHTVGLVKEKKTCNWIQLEKVDLIFFLTNVVVILHFIQCPYFENSFT